MLVETGASSSSASMVLGSNASARRSRLGFTLSIQMVSELTWMKGWRPSAASGRHRVLVLTLRRRRGLRRRHVEAVPVLQHRQRRMRQRALQIAPYPGDVSEVLRPAVAPVEPCENAEDFRGALGGERGVEP